MKIRIIALSNLRNVGYKKKIIKIIISLLIVAFGVLLYYCHQKIILFDTITPMPSFVEKLNWDGTNWLGYSGYRGSYYMFPLSLTEDAIYFSMIRLDKSLNTEVKKEIKYIQNHLHPDEGTIDGAPKLDPFISSSLLAPLALCSSYFNNIDQMLSDSCYKDMDKIYEFIKSHWGIPKKDNIYSQTLKALVPTYKAYNEHNNSVKATEVKKLIEDYSNEFIKNQDINGIWDVNRSNAVQTQLKRDLAILLAHRVNHNPIYLDAVKKNIDWILKYRWDSSTGGIIWYEGCKDFFECHNLWFIEVLQYLNTESGGRYNYSVERKIAWKFLTSNNYADIDLYLHNYINHDAFFAYRAINTEGAIQSSGDFKASYEIGTSLRVMASNYDLVSNYQSFHSDQPYNYLKEQIKQVKKEPKNKGFFGDGTKNIPKDWHPNQDCTFLVIRSGQNYEVQFRQISTSQIGMVYRKLPPITNGITIEFEVRPISTPDKTFQYINFRAEKEFCPSEGITLAFKNDGTISYFSGDEWHILRNYSQGELYHIKISNINLTEGQFNIEINGIIEEKNCPFASSQREINYITIASTGNQPSTVINFDNLKMY